MLTIRYLGAAGWHLPQAGVLIDPYLTRVPAWDVLRGAPLRPDEAAIVRCVAVYNLNAGAILVTHPHFDHLLDVPRLPRSRVFASAQAANLLGVCGTAHDVRVIRGGDVFDAGGARVTAFRTPHRTLRGHVPYSGPLREGLTPPLAARDYRMVEQFSFRIEAGGVRVLLASGIDDEPHTPAEVLISGPDMSLAALTALLDAVQPHTVIANHWDDYFRSFAAPIRPSRMLRNPLRRIDVGAWRRRVRAWGAGVRVVVPHHFEAVHVG